MKLSEIEAFIMAADRDSVVRAVCEPTEENPAAIARSSLKLARELGSQLNESSMAPGETLEQFFARRRMMAEQICCAWLVTYRFGAWTDITKLEKRDVFSPNQAEFSKIMEVLVPQFEQQPPPWLSDWAALQLNRRDECEWHWIRQLVKSGAIPRPTTENYVRKMPRDAAGLRKDPDVLQGELFDLFRTLPSGSAPLIEPSDLDHDSSFAAALRELLAEGLVDRSRLLAATLEALTVGRRPRDEIWFYKFHESLRPTSEERNGLQQSYCDLLRSDNSAVVSFAMAALSVVHQDGHLGLADLLAAADRVLMSPTKGAPLDYLKLLTRISKGQADRSPLGLAAMHGLDHESTEVQEAVLKFLNGLKLSAQPVLAEALAARLPTIAASLKTRAEELWRLWSPSGTAIPGPSLPADNPQAASSAVAIAPAAIIPLKTLDDLIDACAALVEHLPDADGIEKVLDGLSRLCDQRPEDFRVRTAPLRKRIEVLREAETHPPYLEISPQGRLIQVIRLWLDGTPGPRVTSTAADEMESKPSPPVVPTEPTETEIEAALSVSQRRNLLGGAMRRLNQNPVLTFLEGRLEELVARLRRCDARPSLAAPTESGGAIDPAAFVVRLQELERLGLDPQSFDARQGLLRLKISGRDDILKSANELTGTRRDLIDWALGQRRPAGVSEVACYIAATAGRDPEAPLLASDNPPVLEPLTIAWHVTRALPRHDTVQPRWDLTLTIRPDAFSNPIFQFPPLTLCPIAHHAARTMWPAGKANCLSQVWPANPAPFFAAGAVAVTAELETVNNDVQSFPDFLRPLLPSSAPFSEMAQLLLSVSLLARSADLRGLARDVLIAVLGDGRGTGPELGRVLGRLVPSGLVRCQRLAESLAAASLVSRSHRLACRNLVETLLGSPAGIPADAHYLLTLLVDWVAELSGPLDPALRAALERQTGTNKTAKLAKALLKG